MLSIALGMLFGGIGAQLFFLTKGNGTSMAPYAYAADEIETLKEKISSHNKKIKALEAEIAKYQKEAEQAQKDAKGLQSIIGELNATDKKLTTELKVTETRIESTADTLSETESSIGEAESSIKDRLQSLGRSLAILQESDNATLPEIFLSGQPLSAISSRIESHAEYRASITKSLESLKSLQADLKVKRTQYIEQKKKLEGLKADLKYQKIAVADNKTAKSKLLTQTKNKEAEYVKTVAQKKAMRDTFLKELLAFESELSFAVDFSKLPKTGSGVLKWPLDKVTVTQYFGNTSFAQSRPGLYSGIGHNGIDLRALVGTPIKAAASGTIEGTGDTDLTCSGASYGRWILIRHTNGLSTLYGHLSVIRAVKGDIVNTGDIIGYSGNTGYSTGPHLHFTVYATQGVRIMERPSKSCEGGSYIMPVADLKAYLNPSSYV